MKRLRFRFQLVDPEINIGWYPGNIFGSNRKTFRSACLCFCKSTTGTDQTADEDGSKQGGGFLHALIYKSFDMIGEKRLVFNSVRMSHPDPCARHPKKMLFTHSYYVPAILDFIFDHPIAALFVTSDSPFLTLKPA